MNGPETLPGRRKTVFQRVRIICLVLLTAFALLLPSGAFADRPDAGAAAGKTALSGGAETSSEAPDNAAEDAQDGPSYDSALYEEQKRASGADTLVDAAPEDVRALLRRLGLDTLDPEALLRLNLRDLLEGLWQDVLNRLHTPAAVLCQTLAVVLFGALLGVFAEGKDCPQGRVFALVQTLFLCAVLLPPLSACTDAAVALVDAASGFMLAYIPVYAACAALGGHTLAASACHLSFFGAVEALGALLPLLLTPLLYAFLALGVAASAGDETLGRAAGLLQKAASWILGAGCAILSALLSIQTLIAQSAENVLSKTAKYVISSAIPVVGGVLSDALLAVKGSAGVLKAGVGVTGLVIVLAAFLPPLAELVCWSLCLRLGGLAAELFGQKPAASMLDGGRAAVRLLIALVLCMLLLATLSTLILMAAGQGGA